MWRTLTKAIVSLLRDDHLTIVPWGEKVGEKVSFVFVCVQYDGTTPNHAKSTEHKYKIDALACMYNLIIILESDKIY